MKKYLYYPNLEPPSQNWLKFSLLYLDRFESIVPGDRTHLISKEFQQIIEETDLVELYSPNVLQGERASIKAIDETEKILKRTHLRSTLFNRHNLEHSWKNKESFNFQLYSRKFSPQWGEFCEAAGIGIKNNQGLLVPYELGFLYMTHLAKEISFERDLSIITDNKLYDHYTNFHKVFNQKVRIRHQYMKGIVELKLPINISEIPFNKLIEIRNKNRNHISVLNNLIDELGDLIDGGISDKEFINQFNRVYAELMSVFMINGLKFIAIPFAFYVLIKDPDVIKSEYVKETLAALGIYGGGIFALRKSLKETKAKRDVKKYFANISKLK